MNIDVPSESANVFLTHLQDVGTGKIRHIRTIPAQDATFMPWPAGIDPVVRSVFEARGVCNLWAHQHEALEAIERGEHVAISTGTASGKSLIYQIPLLSKAHSGGNLSGIATVRGATTLYLSPTKALAADQRSRLEALAIPGTRIATLDGDTPIDERRWIRQHANIILTNPDLLHHSMLPRHEQWSAFWRSLQIVVIDESHIYRGVFGAHTASIIRRLRRIAARYGANPQFILTSATSADPTKHAKELTGLDVYAVTEDRSARPEVTYALWEPGPPPGEPEADGRRSAVAEAADIFGELTAAGVSTLAFARSRAGVEVMADMARTRLYQHGLSPDAVAAYRGGYLPEERRALENGLREGKLLGLAATSALELGIDISGLDAVVLAGWPGTVASLRQQSGRAGRSEKEALVVFVAADDPLDTFLVNHPDVFFGRPVEATVLDPHNPYVLGPQLACAAAELPLAKDDEQYFGSSMWPLLEQLVAAKYVRRRPQGWFWARDESPGDHVDVRGSGTQDVRIVDAASGTVLGTVGGDRAPSTVHKGAVYVHQGRTFVVLDLDLDDGSALVRSGNPGWSTAARSQSSFDIVESERSEKWGAAALHFGSLDVRTQVTSFLRRLPSGEVIGEHALDLPESTLRTKGVWWTLPESALIEAGLDAASTPGALHAAEHCSIGLISLVAQGDRWDVGGVSTALHPDTGLPTVVVYDALAGGSGFAERAYAKAATWLRATREAIASCPCSSGCPSCIQSPKCGNGNHPLDKDGAIRLLDVLLRDAPTRP